jgi:hypothetical protein
MIWSIIASYIGYICGLFTENLYIKLAIQGIVNLSLYITIITIFYKDFLGYIMQFLRPKKG